MFEETQLRELLRTLAKAPSHRSKHFDPRGLVRVVNALQPLGKERALAVIDEYVRVTPGFRGTRDSLFLVLRLLFAVPAEPGHQPVVGVGAPSPAAPKDLRRLPWFPLAVIGDLPFLVVEGYTLAGFPQQPEAHLEHFRKQGVLRAEPMIPSNDPVGELLRFLDTQTALNDRMWRARGATNVGAQLLRSLDTVHALDPALDVGLGLLPYDAKKARAQLEKLTALTLRWDAARQCYTGADGSRLQPKERKSYPKLEWRPEFAPAVRLKLLRLSDDQVQLWLTQQIGSVPPVSVKIWRKETAVDQDPLVHLGPGDREPGPTWVTLRAILPLPLDSEIRVQLLRGDEVKETKVYRR